MPIPMFTEPAQVNQPLNQNVDPQAYANASKTYADIPSIFSRVRSAAQQSAINLEQIQNARAQRESVRELLELEKKKVQISLDEAKMKGSLSEFARKQIEEQFNSKHGEAKKLLDAQDTITDHADHQHRNTLQQSVAMITSMLQGNPQVQNATPGQSPSPSAGLQAFGGGAMASRTNAPVSNVPSLPMNAQQEPQEPGQQRYEIDMAKALQGETSIKENDLWKKQEEAKIKQDFTINALKINEGDKQILSSVFEARRQGQDISKDAIMSQLSPETAAAIQGLIEYNDDPNIYSRRNNAQAEAIHMARMVDPTYDPTKYAERRKYRLELASEGSFVGKQRIALNTVAQHIAQLDSYIDALGGGNIKPVNMVVNFAKDMTGNPNIATYEQANEAVMSEMQRLLTGVGVTQAGMNEARKIIDRNTGYEAKKAALKSLVRLVEGRITPLKQSFEKKMGRPESGELIYPETQEIFDKYMNNAQEQAMQTSKGTKYRVISE